MKLLEVNNLHKAFDGVRALDGLSLAIEEGQIVSLIGSNGAGKTTLFNAICGFIAVDDGGVCFKGHSLCGLAPYRIARLGISRTFQDLRLLRKVSVLENVMLGFQRQAGEELLWSIVGWKTQHAEHANCEKACALLEFVGLEGKIHDLAENLSYGQQKLLTLACCLAMDADLLLLDEPVAGIDPETTQRILSLLRQLQSSGKTIFLIEHNIEAVKEVSDTVIVAGEGRKIAEGPPRIVMLDPAVLEAYLT